MNLKPIAPESFVTQPHDLWANRWLLLTAGDFKAAKFNTMTVAWGSFGTMWSLPFAMVVVRPSRYTYEFMEQYDSFTLAVLPEKRRPAMQLMGTRSGRDGDKIAAAKLTPVASGKVDAPSFTEAELVLECRKMYRDRMDPKGFIHSAVAANYPGKRDYHAIYFGEILAIRGISAYAK